MTRREFAVTALSAARGLAVLLISASILGFAGRSSRSAGAGAGSRQRGTRYVLLVNAERRIGCGMCVQACKLENGIPLAANASRTWVERYVVTRDGVVHADSPEAGRDGFTTNAIDTGAGHLERIEDADVEKAFFVPRLCNHCENPPCVQVCPVGATYQTSEGVVLVDRETCIGCGYCVMACPYGARFFHPKYKTAEKCTFCDHRLAKGLKPACQEACPTGVRHIGNVDDPDDPVTQTIRRDRVTVLKDEHGCNPQVYYVGLSREVRQPWYTERPGRSRSSSPIRTSTCTGASRS